MPGNEPKSVTLTHVQVARCSTQWPLPVGTIFGDQKLPQETWCIWDGKDWLPFLCQDGQAVLKRLHDSVPPTN
jgi:hypothetical protein